MTARADLLELVDQAPGLLRTIRGHWRSWAHLERTEAAQERAYGAPRLVLSAGYPGPGPAIRRDWQDFWIELPDRWQVVSDGPPRRFHSLDICDGRTRWVGSNDHLLASDRRRMGYDRASNALVVSDPPIEESIYPGAMLGWMRLGDPTEGERGGRRAWKVAAEARPGSASGHAPPEVDFLPGAEHTYIIDAETGIVLSHEASVDGELCIRVWLTDIVVDEPIDPARFRPPPGAVVQSLEEQHLAMLEAHGVDTSNIDPTDPQAVREAVNEWHRSINPEGGAPITNQSRLPPNEGAPPE